MVVERCAGPVCMSCQMGAAANSPVEPPRHKVHCSTVPLSPHQTLSFIKLPHDVSWNVKNPYNGLIMLIPQSKISYKPGIRPVRKRKGPRGRWRCTSRYRISLPTPVNAFSVARGYSRIQEIQEATRGGGNDSTL